MPKVSWPAFTDRFPAAHLIVGEIPQEQVETTNARKRLELVARLLARMDLKGLYALTIDRKSGAPEIHCAFERATDADRVAEALQAGTAGRYPGWATQRSFALGDDAVRTIEMVLGEAPQEG